MHAKKKIAVQLSIKLLLKLKSYSRKGNNLVYLKFNSIKLIILVLSLTAKGEHCLLLFTFLLKKKNFYFEFI